MDRRVTHCKGLADLRHASLVQYIVDRERELDHVNVEVCRGRQWTQRISICIRARHLARQLEGVGSNLGCVCDWADKNIGGSYSAHES